MFRRRFLLAGLALGLYLFLVPTDYEVSFTGVLPSASPHDVWEFVMDFNNHKLLNPTILDFWLIGDEGGGSEWRYKVGYTESLHQLPFIENQAVAEFHCLPLDHGAFLIKSKHRTCFFRNLTCVNSLSEFKFQKHTRNSEDTVCKETVRYECPRILSWFCYNEVMFQRRSIFEKLSQVFDKQQ